MVDLSSDNKFNAWLEDQPQDVCVAIAARAAWRVLPLLARIGQTTKSRRDIILPLLRGYASALVAVKYPTSAEGKKASADAAALSASFVDVRSAALSAALSAASAAAAAADARSAVLSAASAAAAAADAAAAAADSFAAAAAASSAARAAARWDADTIANRGMSPRMILTMPLWPEGIPDFATGWPGEFGKALTKAGDGFNIWADWYYAVMAGMGRPHDAAFARAINDLELWKRSSKEIHAQISAWVEEEREKGDWLEATPPNAPKEAAGPRFSVNDGKLVLTGIAEGDGEDISAQQLGLLERIRKRLPLLVSETNRVANQHEALKIVVDEYSELLSGPVEQLDVDQIWAVGNGLMAQAQAFERVNTSTSTTFPLEPQHLGLLLDVAGLHGGFIHGFERGQELTDKANEARYSSEQTEALKPAVKTLLARLAEWHRGATDKTRHFIAAVKSGVHDVDWATARAGHTAIVTTRNALVSVANAAVEYDKAMAGSAIIGALGAGAAVTAGTKATEVLLPEMQVMARFLLENREMVLQYASQFADLNLWFRYVDRLIQRTED